MLSMLEIDHIILPTIILCVLLSVGVCVVHPLIIYLGVFISIELFHVVLSGHERTNHSMDEGEL